MSREILDKIEQLGGAVGAYREQQASLIANLEDRLSGIETANARVASGGGLAPNGKGGKWTAAQSQAMSAFVRTGDMSKLTAPQAGLSVGTDPDGGYLVTPEYSGVIREMVRNISPIRRLARHEEAKSDRWVEWFGNGVGSSGWVGEAESRPETTAPALIELTYDLYEQYAAPTATQKLLDDAASAEDWLARSIATRFAEQEGAAFVSGDGVKRPRGFLTYPIVSTSDKAGRAFGQLQYIASGAAADFLAPTASVSPADCLVDMVQALKPSYRQNASWTMNALTAGKVRKFKDAQGRPIWTDSIEPGQPNMLLGYPVVEAEDMPDVGAGTYPIALADWQRAYLVIDRNVRFLRDPFTNKPKVVFYATQRVGGGCFDTQALKLLKIAVS